MSTDANFNLTCKTLSLARNGTVLFQGLNLELKEGDLLIIQGANGAGKSSFLMALAGLLSIESGEIILNDKPIDAHPLYPAHALYLGHQRSLYAQMTVYDNVAFWANISNNAETIEAALHYFDLQDIRDFPLRLLSDGWKQRIVLTRLLTMPSKLWLLDEPTANLDNESIALLHSLITARIEQGGVVLMTTHAQVKGERFKVLNINDYKGKSNKKYSDKFGMSEAEFKDA